MDRDCLQATAPPGQAAIADFPRFGLPRRLLRKAAIPPHPTLRIAGPLARPVELDLAALAKIKRREQTCDFHCVFTWSRLGLRWAGWRLQDLYDELVVPHARPIGAVRYLKFIGSDGFFSSLALDFALAEDVLLADTLNGDPLQSEHGAPLRVVAPAHYAYKSVKHLHTIELHSDYPSPYRPGGGGLVAHRDALVQHEQRGQILPGPAYRTIYTILRPAGLKAANRVNHKLGMRSD